MFLKITILHFRPLVRVRAPHSPQPTAHSSHRTRQAYADVYACLVLYHTPHRFPRPRSYPYIPPWSCWSCLVTTSCPLLLFVPHSCVYRSCYSFAMGTIKAPPNAGCFAVARRSAQLRRGSFPPLQHGTACTTSSGDIFGDEFGISLIWLVGNLRKLLLYFEVLPYMVHYPCATNPANRATSLPLHAGTVAWTQTRLPSEIPTGPSPFWPRYRTWYRLEVKIYLFKYIC